MENTHYSSQIVIKLEFSPQILEKYSKTKFHKNPSDRNQVVPCGQRDIPDMTKLIVAFRNLATAPNEKFMNCNESNDLKKGTNPNLETSSI